MRTTTLGRLGFFLTLAAVVAIAFLAGGGVQTLTADSPPVKPTGLLVASEPGSLDVSVDWDDVDDADSHLVRWRVAGPDHQLNDGVEVQASDASITVSDFGEWVVRVEACNDAGCGPGAAKRFTVEAAPEPTPEPPPPNRAPVVDEDADAYADFIGTHNAPRGIWVRKWFDGIFTDPDGDALTYTVSVPTEAAGLVAGFGVHNTQDLLLFQYDAEGDWAAVTPALPNPVVTQVTLTATDPDGLSASLTGPFSAHWEAPPATPTGLAVTSDPEWLHFSASWEATEQTTHYLVKWRLREETEFLPANTLRVETNGATFSVSDAGQWTVQVEACNASGCGPGVSEMVTTVPARPQHLSISAGQGDLNFNASWGAVEGATSYRLAWRRYHGSFIPGNELVVVGTETAFTVADYGLWAVRLEACNASGCGPGVSEMVTTVPARPQHLSISAGQGDLNFNASWGAVEGATSYRLAWRRYHGSFIPGNELVVVGTETAFTVADYGLWAVRLEACAGSICGPGAKETLYLPPPTPQNLSISAGQGDRDFNATWNEVEGATSYNLSWREIEGDFEPGNAVAVTSASASFTVPSYGRWQVRLEACNAAGCGREATTTIDMTPARPQNLVVTSTPGSLSVSATWTAVDGATSYRLLWRLPSGAFESGNEVTATGTSATITLSDYGQWVIRLEGCNAAGCGPGASEKVEVTPSPPPLPPSGLMATASDGTIALSWTDPSDSAISKYQYRVSADGGTTWDPDWSDISGSGAATTSHTVTGLTNGTTYTIELRAVRGVDTAGAASSATDTPMQLEAPSGLTAIAGDRGIALSWADPSDSAIGKYQYRVSADGGTTWDPDWSDISGSGATTTSHTVTGLTNDTTYTFELRAVQGLDTAGASSSVTATPDQFAPPLPPIGLTATAGDGTIVLSWTASSDSSISKYQVRMGWDGGTQWSDWTDIPGSGATTTSHRFDFSSSVNGYTATIELRAMRGETAGAAGSVTATPNVIEGSAPQGLTATEDDTTITLSWTDPDDTTISKYQVMVREDDGTPRRMSINWTDIPRSGAGTTSHTVTELTNEVSYFIEIRAMRGRVAGTPSSVTATPRYPGAPAPSGLTVAEGDATFVLSWTHPMDATISKYQARWSADGGTTWSPDWKDMAGSVAATTSLTVIGLVNDTAYTIEIRAMRGRTAGAAGRVTATPRQVGTPPAAPSGLEATAGNRAIALSWADPEDAAISKYQYRIRLGQRSWSNWANIPGSGSTTTAFTLWQVTPADEDYTISLRGLGGLATAGTDASVSAKPRDLPDPTTVDIRDGELAWIWPAQPVRIVYSTRYRTWDHETRTWSDFTTWETATVQRGSVDGHDLQGIRLSGLTNGTTYNVEIKMEDGNLVEIFSEVIRPALRHSGKYDETSLNGTEGDDFMLTNGNPWDIPVTLSGLGGDDILLSPVDRSSLGGKGTIARVARSATLNGGAGDDVLRGGRWQDILNGGDGNDILDGGPSRWSVLGAWDDILNGGPGDDILSANGFFDILNGGAGVDLVTYSAAAKGINATLSGGGDKTIDGVHYIEKLTGIEKLFGSLHDDTLRGDDLANTFNGSLGDDTLIGLGGADNFLFFFHNFNFGDDTITDFHLAATLADSDRLFLCPGEGVAMSAVTVTGADSGSDRVITIAVGGDQKGTITLEGITSASTNLQIGIPAANESRASCEYSLTPPPAPTNLDVKVGIKGYDFGSSTLAWDFPSDTSITGYETITTGHNPDFIFWRINGKRDFIEFLHDPETPSRLKKYEMIASRHTKVNLVRAVRNHVIRGVTATSATFTKVSRPATPINLGAAAGDASVALTWNDPLNAEITKYQYTVWTGTTRVVDWTDIPGSGASTTSYTVSGLTNGTAYTIYLRAVSGDFAYSERPAGVVATPTN